MLDQIRRTARRGECAKGHGYLRAVACDAWCTDAGLDTVSDLVSTYVIILKEDAGVESGILFVRDAIGGDLRASQPSRSAESGHQERQLSQQTSWAWPKRWNWGQTIV